MNRSTSARLGLGALSALTLSASLVLPVTPVQAAPPGVTGSSPVTSRAEPACSLLYDGIAGKRQFGRRVADGVVTDEYAGYSVNFRMIGRGYAAFEERAKSSTTIYHVLTEDRRPALLSLKSRNKTGDVFEYRVDLSDTKSLRARTFTSPSGFYVFTGRNDGSVVRYTNTRRRDGATVYADKTEVLPKGSPVLDSLQYVTTRKVSGVRTYLFVGTTRDGALVRLSVPVKKPGKAKLRTISASGFDGVREISPGFCDGKRNSLPLVLSNPAAGTASWVVVSAFTREVTATEPTLVTGAEGWDFEAVL